MKLQFDPNLPHQRAAVEAVCGIFRGQETGHSVFTVRRARLAADGQARLDYGEEGVGNRLNLPLDEILRNLNRVQAENGLPRSHSLSPGELNFTVEMETGTGKTYVYLRTIFELNRRYGFLKFVIVVPSVAIKEGVYKTLQITREHFRGEYAGVAYEYFQYDSAHLNRVRNFATSGNIQIMVVTVGAINKKDVNNLYKQSEQLQDLTPIDFITDTRPVLIVDEPQSVDGGLKGSGKAALDAMRPLCTLRYSATHADKHHMVYRLDAVDAYTLRLVKQIEVAGATVQDAHNKPYVRLVSVEKKRNDIYATVEIDAASSRGRVSRETRRVHSGEDLEQTTGRELYRNYRVGDISVKKDAQFMELRLPNDEIWLKPGQIHGGADVGALHRQMIQRTIREHLRKEIRLRPQGIKTLSLFFVDNVDRYRKYDADGKAGKGELALIFEEEFARLLRHPEFKEYYAADPPDPEQVHNGYFSIDKAGRWTNTSESSSNDREQAELAYHLIMREKERLLDLNTPLRFIFSHSALREGWDNPNVFQICALREMQSERERRQTIGRGLRLCVNQRGERVHGFDVNTLTVVATESYQEFAERLQKEIEDETGLRFGVIESFQFSALQLDDSGALAGDEGSRELFLFLQSCGYLDAQGRIQDALRAALRDNALELPERFSAVRAEIAGILRRAAGRVEIKDADAVRIVAPRRAVLDSAEFRALWQRIRDRTTYRLNFDNGRLIEDCIHAVQRMTNVARSRLKWSKAELQIEESGVSARNEKDEEVTLLDAGDIELPDLLTELQNRTKLTRRSLFTILNRSGRLEDFLLNPQQFMELAADAINGAMRHSIVDGIKYQRLGDSEYYAQELFLDHELRAHVENCIDSSRSPYEAVVWQSETERKFAEDLEKNSAVKVYAKLPDWFKIPTPLGEYTPDWAVVLEAADGERLYFVVETKSTLDRSLLRPDEDAKITCGEQHFLALQREEKIAPAHFGLYRYVDDLTARGR